MQSKDKDQFYFGPNLYQKVLPGTQVGKFYT